MSSDGDASALTLEELIRNKQNTRPAAPSGEERPSRNAAENEKDSDLESLRLRNLSSALNSKAAPRHSNHAQSERRSGRISSGVGEGGNDDPFFPVHQGRPADNGAPDLRLFTGGLADYARLANRPGGHDEEDYGTEQRLAERFANKPPQEPVYIPERPLMQAIVPYIAAAGFFVFAGTGSALYFFKSEPSSSWGGYGSATAATVTEPKIDAALTSFIPKSVREPAAENAADAVIEVHDAPPPPKIPSWTDAVETFKNLAGPKTAAAPSKTGDRSAEPLLKAIGAWPKSGS